MAVGALYGGNGAGDSVSPFLPGVIPLLMALPAKLAGISQGEESAITQMQTAHIGTVMAGQT